ncbi:MAG: RHS repeat-associated core domain-containing protein [Candidatus Riflebacteria bacterium]|nr:RHS repeat-associated core domain-containing protein [Candidatus Riflebacteria bacterium]
MDTARTLGSSTIDPWWYGKYYAATLSPHLYTGRRFSPVTGLYNLRYRYYQPKYGRFVNSDPLGFGAGPNRYWYVRNSPYRWIDPWGLCPEDSWSNFEWEMGDTAAQAAFTPYGAYKDSKSAYEAYNQGSYLKAGMYGAGAAMALIPGEKLVVGGAKIVGRVGGKLLGAAEKLFAWGSKLAREEKEVKVLVEEVEAETKLLTQGGKKLIKMSEKPFDIQMFGGQGGKLEVKTRPTQGIDGGTSQIIIERDATGKAISQTHRVTTDGEIVHQHQTHIGEQGGQRSVPDEWTGNNTINAQKTKFKPSQWRSITDE